MELDALTISMIVATASTAVLFFNWKFVRLGMNVKKCKKKGLGQVAIIGKNFIIRPYWRSFSEKKCEIDGGIYNIHPKYVVHWMGVPTIFFYEDDSEPIDMLKRKVLKPISPMQITAQIQNATEINNMLSNKQKKMEYYMLIGACAGGVGSLLLLLSQSGMLG